MVQRKIIQNVFSLTERIQDNIKAFGHFEAAKIMENKIPFSIYHYFAFGYLPRAKLIIEPIYLGDSKGHATYKRIAIN